MKPQFIDDDNIILEQEPEDKGTETKTDNPKDNPSKTDNPGKADNPNATDDNPFLSGSEDTFGSDTSEPEYSLTDIGKVYVLRQIYQSLNELQQYAMELKKKKSNKKIDKVIADIGNAKDLFVLLANNIDKYLDRLDIIIDEFRKFIIVVSKILTQEERGLRNE